MGTLLLLASLAFGHGVDQDQIMVDVTDDRVLFAVTPRASLFPTADEDGDGELSIDEIRRHRDVIDATIDDGLSLTDQRGRRGRVYFSDVVLPHAFDDDAHRAEHVRIIRRLRFADDVTAVNVDVRLFGPQTDRWTAHVRMGGTTRSFEAVAPHSRVVVERPADASATAVEGRKTSVPGAGAAGPSSRLLVLLWGLSALLIGGWLLRVAFRSFAVPSATPTG